MAAKGKSKGGEKKGIGGLIVIIVICVLLLFITFAVFVVGFDALGLRTRYLEEPLRNVPLVNRLLPPLEDEYEDEDYYEDESYFEVDEYEFEDWTFEDFVERIEELAGRLNVQQARINAAQEEIDEINEISEARHEANVALRERLEELEATHEELRRTQEEFERIAALSDPAAFQEFFERINPERAEQLYREAVVINQETQQVRDFLATVSRMEDTAAAGTLQAMMAEDIHLVAAILENIGVARRSIILSEFSNANAAQVLLVMAPDSLP